MRENTRHIAMTIAGSDSGGGAGIQADLKTFAAWGCYGTSVVVSVTAQDTLGVHAVHPVPTDIIMAQLDAVANDLPPDAVKTGMLGTLAVVELVAEALDARDWSSYVLDPVMVASSGDRLLDHNAIEAVRALLLPQAIIVTPNLDEAELLTGLEVRDPESMVRAGEMLVSLGAGSALVKGGHLDSDILVDVLVTQEGVERYTRPRIVTQATHGTGCTLSAALTAAALRNNDITIYGDGLQTRTFTYVEDTVNVCNSIFENKLLVNDVINVGNDELMTIKDLATLTIKLTNSNSNIIHLPPLKEGDMTRRQPDNTKMKEILKKKLITVEEGINRMINDERFLKSIA